jgi:thymidylate synthase
VVGAQTASFPTTEYIKSHARDIDDCTFEDFEIIGYDPYPTVKIEMAVCKNLFAITQIL